MYACFEIDLNHFECFTVNTVYGACSIVSFILAAFSAVCIQNAASFTINSNRAEFLLSLMNLTIWSIIL